MSIVGTEKKIRKLRRFLGHYENSPKMVKQVEETRRELAGQERLLVWLKTQPPKGGPV
jgi:hypothetical protein